MHAYEEVKNILVHVLNLGERGKTLQLHSLLLGRLAELDSMAVISVITALEDQFGIAIGDDEINADTFQSLGSLVQFVEEKLQR